MNLKTLSLFISVSVLPSEGIRMDAEANVYDEAKEKTEMSVIWIPIIIIGGGGLIAFIIFLYDKKHHNSNPSNYPPNYYDNFALKKDVYTKEEVEKIIEDKVKEMSK